ncbi:hypothetical protein AB0C59_05250 [Streptomyces sp. NPDC048664]|uniref:hypothetical protein n=1 Tax=Streptomyces sp. NPDC048664 TaxID=3154505 RepID=UPI003428CC5D
MHAYDAPHRQTYQPIPSGRAGQDPSGGFSTTPIYDALCAEYVRAFRTLPGDRGGEQDMAFRAFSDFSAVAHDPGAYDSGSYSSGAAGSYGTGAYDTGTYGTGSYATGSYSALGAHGARQTAPQHGAGRPVAGHGAPETQKGVWQQVARRGMQHVPALPPAPRRGL